MATSLQYHLKELCSFATKKKLLKYSSVHGGDARTWLQTLGEPNFLNLPDLLKLPEIEIFFKTYLFNLT